MILDAASWQNSKKSIPFIKKNIDAKKIYIVSSKKIASQDLLGLEFLDENEILKESASLSFNAVSDFLKSLGGDTSNAGWYLQQFLKLGISKICKDDYYLVWDADTIPLNKIDFFDSAGKPYFNLKREYFAAYFRTIDSLFGIQKTRKESFISEHMLFDAKTVREMIAAIEANQKIAGDFFWQKILIASDLRHYDFIKTDQRFFSEFETFGTYAEHFHPGLYATRKLRTLRNGTDFLGKNPAQEILEWAAKDFDTISFEEWGKPLEGMALLTQDSERRKKTSFADTLRFFLKSEKRKIFARFPHIDREQARHFFDNTLSKTNFDFFFSKKCAWSNKKSFFLFSFLDRFRFFNITKNRIKRYWFLLTFQF